jgi:hypothetical protein
MKKITIVGLTTGLAFLTGCVSPPQQTNQSTDSAQLQAQRANELAPMQQKNVDDPAETALWEKATSPFVLTEIQTYLVTYPNGKHALDARQIIADEQTIEDIENKGVGDHFVIPKDSWPPFVVNSVTENQERGRTILTTLKEGLGSANTVFGNTIISKLPTTIQNSDELNHLKGGGPFFPCGNRSVFIVNGKINNIVGDSSDPIRLVYSASKGLIVIAGKGKIIGSDNNPIYETP